MLTCQKRLPDSAARIFVAYSGGLDSSVLLHLLRRERGGDGLIAWHVNHGLQAAADAMEQFCREQAGSLGVRVEVDRLDMADVDGNIEAEARERRYRLFASRLAPDDLLLTAHHADDQAETFLLNAMRGSGSAGLSGIAAQRDLGEGLLLRPLLDYSRDQLEAYAREHEIAWFNDPSNSQLRFDRNYLRKEVMPVIRARWPHALGGFGTACALQAETRQLLDEIAEADFELCRRGASERIATLDISGLLALSPGRRNNLIRYWVRQAGFGSLPQGRLGSLLEQLEARPDRGPRIDGAGFSIRIYDRRLFLVPEIMPPAFEEYYAFGQQPRIAIEPLNLDLSRAAILAHVGCDESGQELTIRLRRCGVPDGDRHRLKRLFQKHRVPPWRRDRVPQVYLDERLVGILA